MPRTGSHCRFGCVFDEQCLILHAWFLVFACVLLPWHVLQNCLFSKRFSVLQAHRPCPFSDIDLTRSLASTHAFWSPFGVLFVLFCVRAAVFVSAPMLALVACLIHCFFWGLGSGVAFSCMFFVFSSQPSY